jgi:hypothetical protein
VVAHLAGRRSRGEAPRIGRDRLQRFFDGVEQTGNCAKAANAAGIDENVLKELREGDVEFDHRVKTALRQSLEQKSTLLAIEGLFEPVITDGKVARDDDGNPIAVRRYSDTLLLALLRAEIPDRFALTTKTIHSPWVQRLAWASLAVFALWVIGDLGIRLLVFAAGHPHG